MYFFLNSQHYHLCIFNHRGKIKLQKRKSWDELQNNFKRHPLITLKEIKKVVFFCPKPKGVA